MKLELEIEFNNVAKAKLLEKNIKSMLDSYEADVDDMDGGTVNVNDMSYTTSSGRGKYSFSREGRVISVNFNGSRDSLIKGSDIIKIFPFFNKKDGIKLRETILFFVHFWWYYPNVEMRFIANMVRYNKTSKLDQPLIF